MPNLSNIHFIVFLMCAMHMVGFGLAGGWFAYRHREQHDRSRLYMACAYGSLTLGGVIFVVTGLVSDDLNGFLNTILEPYPMMISFIPSMTFPLYVLEVQQPNWLNWKRFFIIISPWLALCAAWLIYHGMHHWQPDAITHLTDFRQIAPNITATDVQLRVLMNVTYVAYVFAMLLIPYNWRTSNVCASQLVKIKWMTVLCILVFAHGVNLRINELFIAFFIVLDVLTVYIIVIEQTGRIPVPITPSPITPHPAPQLETVAPGLSRLAQHLQQQLALQIWQNPDISRDDICQLLDTNRTYLASAVQELGYDNFTEMINQQRVKYVHDQLLRNPNAVISDVIFHAGFRNRTTAVTYFKQVYDCTPSEFVKG